MFSLALTLDIDKKSFRDCVIQIDSTFSSGLFFNFKFEKHLITSTQRHDIINEKGVQGNSSRKSCVGRTGSGVDRYDVQ
jgi:hypothetical protein